MTGKTKLLILTEDMPVVKKIFTSTKYAWIWLIIRLFIGYQWLAASIQKLTAPEWMRTGEALKVNWMNAVLIPDSPARPAIRFDWFRNLIQLLLDSQSYLCLAKLIALCEFLVGLALIVGVFVGIAAFIGGLMNVSCLLAGSLGSGPILLVLEILLIIAWKTAGYYGLDRYFFKFIGAPWKPGKWFQKKPA